MHTLNQTLKTLIPLAVVFSLLVATNFLYAAWDAPTGTPSELNNVSAPVNISSTVQDKTGALGVGGLAVFGHTLIEHAGPRIEFSDTDNTDWWIHVNNNRMYFINDRDDSGDWTGESPWPLYLEAGATSADDYVRASNEVHSPLFCNETGTYCMDLRYRWVVSVNGVCSGYYCSDVRSNACLDNQTGLHVSTSLCPAPAPAIP